MTDIPGLAAAALSGGSVTLAGQWAATWLKLRNHRHGVDRQADAKLAEHRDDLTLKLLDAAQSSVVHLQKQVSELLPLMPAAAHLAEALDHIHAILHANGEAEMRAAERRARAFLRRMRPGIGDLRNTAQAAQSAKNIVNDVGGEI